MQSRDSVTRYDVAEGVGVGVGVGRIRERGTERARARRLATLYTAAAFHNRLAGDKPSEAPLDRAHHAWANAWDRVAALVRSAYDGASLARLAARLEREAREGESAEWRAVCAHAAGELSRVTARRR